MQDDPGVRGTRPRVSRRVAIHQREKRNHFPAGNQRLRHLVDELAALGEAAQVIGPVGLDPTHVPHHLCGHLLQAADRMSLGTEFGRVQHVQWLIGLEFPRQRLEADDCAAPAGDEEERRPVAGRLDCDGTGCRLIDGLAAQQHGQAADRGRIEQGCQPHRALELLLDPVNQPEREERVTSEIEKGVMHADVFDTQHLGPDDGQRRLGSGARGDMLRLRDGRLRRRQRLAVYLAVRQEGHFIQFHEVLRHHVLRQIEAQVLPQRRRRDFAAGSGDDVSNDANVCGTIFSSDDHAAPDSRM
jgi:hypothetical protein